MAVIVPGATSGGKSDQPTVRCAIARNDEPWKLDIDGIVLSVGADLGGLAQSVRAEFPDAAWEKVNRAEITPERPYVMDLFPASRVTDLRVAIVATPHERNKYGSPSVAAARVATGHAIRSAMDHGVAALGLPLLGTGIDQLNIHEVARGVVAEVVSTLEAEAGTSLRDLVFLCKDKVTEAVIRNTWASLMATPLRTVRVLPPAVAPLAGGVSADLVDPAASLPLSADKLDVSAYVSMLATVIAGEETPLPLSIGIFGEWGSGKSFFMGLLRHEVQLLAESETEQYCHTIEQIRFNAWHYADSNLWASLGDEIFRHLARVDPPVGRQRERLSAAMAPKLVQHQELEAAAERARAEVAELRQTLDRARAEQEAQATNLLAALPAATKRQLDSLWHRLGVADEAEQGRLLAEQVGDGFSEMRALRHATNDRVGRAIVGVSALLLSAVACIAVVWPTILATVGPVLTLALGTGVAMVGRVRQGLRSLRALTDDLLAGRLAKIEQTPEVTAKRAALLRAAEQQQIAEARLADAVVEVDELGRRLRELDPGRRLYSFLADRANGDTYTSGLGLITMIRKDFEQLVALMADMKEATSSGRDGKGQKPVQRIVLYIDDLDRCSPRQVVDVLQAVHLLLAMKLFVVVVGVDPRWLLRSLSSHYHELLDDDIPRRGDPWLVTPEDYLEKIFNIPFVLPGLSSDTLADLLRSLAAETGSTSGLDRKAVPGQDRRTVVTPPEHRGRMTVERDSQVAKQRSGSADVPARPLTDPELALMAALDVLIDTPREAKRLANIYRMVRATRDLTDAARFLGDVDYPGEFQAVVLLLGLLTTHGRLLSTVLDAAPSADGRSSGGLLQRPPETPWATFVSDMAPKRAEPGWTNRVVGALDEVDVPHWSRLHKGLDAMAREVTLRDISTVQEWAPIIRRFSYLR